MSENKETFDLQAYLTKGVEQVVADALKATLKDPRESAFLLKFAAASRAASKKRREAEDAGEHIPSYLIASITSACNLHCAGCYSRCNKATVDAEPVQQLSTGEWLRVFDEAEELGISFILLAGGEPMLRRDVIEAAGKKPNILFPILTNGTFIDRRYFELFDRCRNLVPVMSIEGERELTDARRGKGVYERLIANMDEFRRRGLIFGASVTVTTQNLREVSAESFLKTLSDRGCKLVIFVEFVPVTEEARDLAPGDEEREFLRAEIARLRAEHPEMVYRAPGDGVYLLPRRREGIRRLRGGRARLLPHQFPRRGGALPLLALLGREHQKLLAARGDAFAALYGAAQRRHPAGRPRGRLRAV